MRNSTTGFGAQLRAVALGLCLATTAVAFAALPAQAAEKKKEQEQLSPKFAAKYKPAVDAFNKDDLDTSLGLAKDALALAEKPYDKITAMILMRSVYGKKKDYAAYADMLEQLDAMDTYSEEDRIASYKPLAQINAQNRNYEKAIPYTIKWADNGGGSDAYGLLWQLYLIQKDCAHGIVALEKAVEGRDATETELRQENACYFQLGDKPKRQAVMEQLVKRFLKHDYIYDLLQIYEEQKIDAHAKLNIRRLEVYKDYLTRESEFSDFTEEALDAGSPTEALTVINHGIELTAVKLIAASDHNSRLLAQAKQQAAEDKKTIAALDKEAQAGKSGEADVKVGLVYLGLGENQKAVDSIQRGLGADRVGKVKRVDDANMMLGIAYAKLGNKDEAKKAFAAAATDPRMTKAATIWADSL